MADSAVPFYCYVMITKEKYYTAETIASQSREFHTELEGIRKSNREPLDPAKMVLLIMDMQSFFFEPVSHAFIPSASAILPIIQSVRDRFISKGIAVIYTRHINSSDNAKKMGTWWRDILERENPFSQLVPGIILPDSVIVEKSQYDAFYQTELEEYLIETGKKQLIISGVMTHLCCETTARSAFLRGFDIYFGIDMTATYNRQLHRASLLTLSHGFAEPVLSGELFNRMEKIER